MIIGQVDVMVQVVSARSSSGGAEACERSELAGAEPEEVRGRLNASFSFGDLHDGGYDGTRFPPRAVHLPPISRACLP